MTPQTKAEARAALSTLLRSNGAVAFGTVKAEPVSQKEWEFFEKWLTLRRHAGMAYMENHRELRRDPRNLLKGAQSVVSVAFNYMQPNPFPGIATYALGEDYHKVLRRRLKAVVREMKAVYGGEWRICIDSAPVLERYWAVKAGVGWRNPVHGNVVVPGIGSMVFLAELLTTLPLWEEKVVVTKDTGKDYIEAEKGEDGKSHPVRCLTGALQSDGTVDAARCINYLTIEYRGVLDETQRKLVGNAKFGCDFCLRSSPENQCTAPAILDEFKPMTGLGEYLETGKGYFDIGKSPMKRKLMNKN